MESIFIDTSVIIDLLRGKEKAVTLFRQIESGEVRGFANKIAFLETIHVYLILTTQCGPKSLRKSFDLIKDAELSPVFDVFDILHILPVDTIPEKDVVDVLRTYGLLPNDALIAATCKHYGIRKIATSMRTLSGLTFLKWLKFETKPFFAFKTLEKGKSKRPLGKRF